MTSQKTPSGTQTAHLATNPICPPRPVSSKARGLEPALIDSRQAADLLGVSLRKFHSLRPHLPKPVVLGARAVRWRTAELREYVANLTGSASLPEPSQLAAARSTRAGGHKPVAPGD